MIRVIATLHLLGIQLHDRWAELPRRDERGSVTIEHVAWAAAVITIVTIAVVAITAYVRTQVGKL